MHLRHGTIHDVLACWFGMDRSTLTRAIGEGRPLLVERGRTVSPGLRLRTLAEVVDHLGAGGKTGIIAAPRSGPATVTRSRTDVSPVQRAPDGADLKRCGCEGRSPTRRKALQGVVTLVGC
ncbi:transposase family protein [Streptomyces sp. GD-15H]|uniref:transposase family protein n=1 Tax=Streptomyces sp. GD-15H TaxID=3129112 RepID=UPI0038735610